jgi:hypothetical protein
MNEQYFAWITIFMVFVVGFCFGSLVTKIYYKCKWEWRE